MIITAMAMYLNVVHQSSFDYIGTFFVDLILVIGLSSNVKNIIKRSKKEDKNGKKL